MLTEEEETKLACAMALLDVLDQNKIDGHETLELKESALDLMAWVSQVFKTLSPEETVQVIDRYKKERAEAVTLKNHKALFL